MRGTEGGTGARACGPCALISDGVKKNLKTVKNLFENEQISVDEIMECWKTQLCTILADREKIAYAKITYTNNINKNNI